MDIIFKVTTPDVCSIGVEGVEFVVAEDGTLTADEQYAARLLATGHLRLLEDVEAEEKAAAAEARATKKAR